MPLTVGTRLGPYEILAPLGAGGMGEVYKARDAKLQRDVALKVLLSPVESDPVALDRFQREARTIAALNHPHIVTIYAVEEFEGRAFLAMELVDGSTLAHLLPAGGLPLDVLLKYAIPLADALSAAHAQGITHRDLKPSNVMITKDGRLKVLDFGLAKLREEVVQFDATVGPTRPLTGQGQIVGTVAYMSPEQASGGAIDHRSDVFSFGVLLYELATGERPFKGDGSVSVLASILKDTPKPITELRPELPRDLARIVRRALAKDPEQRYQTAKDLRNDLQTLKDDLTSGDLSVSMPAAMAPARRRPMAIVWTSVAVAIIAIAVSAYVVLRQRTAAGPPVDAMTITRLTSDGKASLAAISPDGKYAAHVVSDHGYGLWMRQTATTSNVQIVPPGPDRFIGLAFSPDGDYLYFTRLERRISANVYRVPVLGGTPQPVIRDVDSSLAFSPDGSRFAFIRGVPSRAETRIMVARAGANEPPVILAMRKWPNSFVLGSRPAWSPDGRTIAVAVGYQITSGYDTFGTNSTVVGIDVGSGQERALTSTRWDSVAGVAWVSGGRAMVVSGTEPGKPNFQIWRVNGSDGVVRRVTNDLASYRDVAAAAAVPAVVTALADLSSSISIISPGNATPQAVTSDAGRYDGQTGVAWTPDGRIVFSASTAQGIDLWMIDANGGNARQLTADAAPENHPSVSPDGRSVVFTSVKRGHTGIWRLAFDTSQLTQITDSDADQNPEYLPDGKSIVFTKPLAGTYRVGIDGGTPARIGSEADTGVALSPDGQRVAALMMGLTPRRTVIGFVPLDGTPATQMFDIVSLPLVVAWTPTGDALTFLESRTETQSLWNQPAAGGAPQLLLDLHGDRIFNFAWSRDGRLAVAHGPVPTDIVLMSGIQ